MKPYILLLIACVLLQSKLIAVVMAQNQVPNEDLLKMDVKEFFNMYQEVFSASTRTQKLRDTSSAVYILDQDDISRSGATTIPDLLRLVPGVQVAQIGANTWSVSVRGINVADEFNNQLLVLIDGAPIVTPGFNGVFWEAYSLPLDVIERIEVVRGPGAAIWGNRAENGVINIITKKANQPSAPTFSLGGGSEHEASVYVRQGIKLGEYSGLNVSLKYDRTDSSKGLDGKQLRDGGDIVSLTARGDLKVDSQNSFRVTNYTWARTEGLDLDVPVLHDPFSEHRQGNIDHIGTVLSTLFSHKLDNGSEVTVDWSQFAEKEDDFTKGYALFNTDLDVRYRFSPYENHDLIIGSSARLYVDSFDDTFYISLQPRDRTLHFFRGFFHDEISLNNKQLIATVGSRFEENPQNGFSSMPTARLLWHATDTTSLWGAVSYTVGTTSRVYDDVKTRAFAFADSTTGLPAVLQFTGNRDLSPEKLLAYEFGARTEPNKSLFADVSGFYFKYSDLFSTEPGEPMITLDDPSQTPFLLVPLIADSRFSAETYGVELTATWHATKRLKCVSSYSYFLSSAQGHNSFDPISEQIYENLPSNIATLRLNYDPLEDVQTDAIFRFVDKLSNSAIPSYGELDLRLGWKFSPTLRLSLVGRNLLQPGHVEFKSWTLGYPLSQVERSVFFQIIKSF